MHSTGGGFMVSYCSLWLFVVSKLLFYTNGANLSNREEVILHVPDHSSKALCQSNAEIPASGKPSLTWI